MTEIIVKTPIHLWIVGVVALLFNSIGAFDFLMNIIQGADYMASAGMTPAQIAHYQELPVWMMAVWAIGVWGAFLASILLLMRKKAAFTVFVVSLVAFFINLFHMYLLTDGSSIMGEQMAITNVVIASLLVFFSWYSRAMASRSVLN